MSQINLMSKSFGSLLNSSFTLGWKKCCFLFNGIILLRERYKLLKDSNFNKANLTKQEALQYINVMNTGRISFRQFSE